MLVEGKEGVHRKLGFVSLDADEKVDLATREPLGVCVQEEIDVGEPIHV